MFIAHAPAGYLLAKAAVKTPRLSLPLLLTGLFFALAPDLDLIWFYTLGARRVPHHAYITHWPMFWAALFIPALGLSFILRKAAWRPYLLLGFACVLLHLALDTVAAELYWFAPFSYAPLQLAQVQARYAWWVWNYVLHWTFALELLICLTAAFVFFVSRKKNKKLKRGSNF